jgi:lipopolysaccharide/colanic/teichoic acid biosynthesis glycosyltransferase
LEQHYYEGVVIMARSGQKQGLEQPARNLDIHSAREFQAILKYERARADRASSQFALVALNLNARLEDSRVVQRLIQALRHRIRNTDVLGCLDNHTLGILLPGTDTKGARIFTVNFEKHYFTELPPAPFTIYCYPDHWLRNGKGSLPDGEDSAPNWGPNLEKAFRMAEGTLSRSIPVWKRTLDVVGSLLGLILSSPLFLIMSVYIKIVSPGPVFFKQQRVGYRASPFTFLKFRTMCVNNDAQHHQAHLKELINSDQPMEKLDDGRDPRIIPGGRVIRKACIDEFPQLVNVLKGEMSLVGPRPCLPYEAEEYLRWHRNRFDVLPGLTGLWQVSGKNKLTFKQMIRLDISYCQNFSLWLDLKTLLFTLPAIVSFVSEAVVKRIRGSVQETRAENLAESVDTRQVRDSFAEQL